MKPEAPSSLLDHLPAAAVFALLLAAWQWGTRHFQIPEYILPSPLQILTEMLARKQALMTHSVVTMQEILLGFSLGLALACTLSLGILYSRTVEKVAYPFVLGLQVVPKVAIAPLLVIWFGYGLFPKVMVSAVICFFPLVVNTVRGLTSVDPELLDLASSLNATPTQVLLKIRIPSSLPFVFAGLKVAITLSVIGAVVGEFVGADRGLGYLIMIANANLDTSYMFAALVILSAMGIVLFLAVCLVERVVLASWPLRRGAAESL